MAFTSIYMLAAIVILCLVGFLAYRKGGRRLALVTVFSTFAFLLITLVGFIIVATNGM